MNSNKGISMKMLHPACANDLAESLPAVGRERETFSLSSLYDVRLSDKLYTGSILTSLI